MSLRGSRSRFLGRSECPPAERGMQRGELGRLSERECADRAPLLRMVGNGLDAPKDPTSDRRSSGRSSSSSCAGQDPAHARHTGGGEYLFGTSSARRGHASTCGVSPARSSTVCVAHSSVSGEGTAGTRTLKACFLQLREPPPSAGSRRALESRVLTALMRESYLRGGFAQPPCRRLRISERPNQRLAARALIAARSGFSSPRIIAARA